MIIVHNYFGKKTVELVPCDIDRLFDKRREGESAGPYTPELFVPNALVDP
jgi:hypothetical protein